MSNGKRVLKSDVVILSIKPQRPEFTPDKKLVPVRVALQEWDKLDAYYRGQILKLKNKVKNPESRKSGKSSTTTCKKSSTRRSSSSGQQLSELFGDENVPINETDERASDEENKRPRGDRNRSSSRKHRDIRDSSIKSEKIKCESNPRAKDEEEENYLSVPRDNFVIEFAINQKKRTPVHRPDLSGLINPIKVEPYKPPIAIGFNGVHIQKILYHKTDGLQQTSPTTTAASTPEKQSNMDSNSQSPFLSRIPENFNGSAKVNENSPNSSTFSSPLPMKRKCLVSTCTTRINNSEGLESPPKKLAKEQPKVICPLLPPPPPPKPVAGKKNNTSPSSKPCLSITDQIIKKGNELPPELKEREKRRKQESQRRKAYAVLKTHEHTLMDSVDVSIKAMEFINYLPLMSPIRSP